MKKWLVIALAHIGLVVGAWAFWQNWGFGFHQLHKFRSFGVVPIQELAANPLRYLNKRITVQGYLAESRGDYDALIYASKEDAEMQNDSLAVAIAYPGDAKIACLNSYVRVMGVSRMNLPKNEYYSFVANKIGIGDIEYFGKLEDSMNLPTPGLRRPSCPSNLLPDNYGFGIQRDPWGQRIMPRPYIEGDVE